MYALLKHQKIALCQQKIQQLTPLLTSVCSSTKESEATFGNAVSASMEATSESQLALQIWQRQKKKRMSCTLKHSFVKRTN
jgi:hypothetical protein